MRTIRKSKGGKLKVLLFLSLSWICFTTLSAQNRADSTSLYARSRIYQLGIESRPGFIFTINDFLKGDNEKMEPIDNIYSTHLRYSFQFHPNSFVNKIYRGVYQGIGLTHYEIESSSEIGTPIALYLFQGATIAQLTPKLSLNYEWNFGISGGWKPYDKYTNPYNGMMGSKFNAYMNANFFFKQQLSTKFDVVAGASVTHFSNGNTKYPNAGLNATDVKVGLTYNFNRTKQTLSERLAAKAIPTQKFPKHISTDVVIYGSWRSKGFELDEETSVSSPERYSVIGFNINPMYNMNYNLRFGLSLDGVYDSSANVYTENYIIGAGEPDPGFTFYDPPLKKQFALGLSARGEYVMPYFTVGLGVGTNILHGGGDYKGLYQIFALKIEMTRNSFIHIGYNLKDFKDPNYLMLGIGYRFGNEYPYFWR